MRLIRARSGSFNLNPARIGVIGFSAGGHLAGMTATQPLNALYGPVDSTDAASARPDFAALIYPVLTMMPPFDRTHTRREILGAYPSDAQRIAYSVERHVDHQTPNTFLAQALDDPISPIDNSLPMFSALRQANVPTELHIFQSGGHGWGLGSSNSPVHAWPTLFTTWATLNGF
jgi:acetyl esterase/lipase